MNEIKQLIKEINEKLSKKKDSFKEWSFKMFQKLLEFAVLGGLLYYFLNIMK
jgi:hypothetical protein